MSRYPLLQELIIGDDCFWFTDSFVIEGLMYLQRISIGVNSFTKHKNGNWGSSNPEPLDNKNRYLRIVNCPHLEELYINSFSFDDYGGGFTLTSSIILLLIIRSS